MKRVLIVFAILLFAAAGLSAQITDYDKFGDAFEDFASEIATTLPSTAAVSGLNWSPAYIGEFPHFGVGASIGAFTIPYDFVQPLITDLGISLPSEFDYIEKWGMPIPAIALDARLGGFVLPFDVGVKVGYIPEEYRDKLTRIHADYRLFGGDARLRLIEGRGLLPTLSVGGGYTYLEGSVSVPDVATSTEINIDPILPGHTLEVSSPDLTFNFQTNTLMGKAQASWDLEILIPHVGLGAAYGLKSNAGGGLTSQVLYDGAALTDPADIQAIKDAFALAGYSIDELDATGITISEDASGFSFWLYGGTAVKLVFLAIDLSAMYNPISQAYGGAVNVRVQL